MKSELNIKSKRTVALTVFTSWIMSVYKAVTAKRVVQSLVIFTLSYVSERLKYLLYRLFLFHYISRLRIIVLKQLFGVSRDRKKSKKIFS